MLGSNHYGQLGNGKHTNELEVAARDHGTVTTRGFRCHNDSFCSLERPPGTVVVLRERPDKGWKFERWTGACRSHASRCVVVLTKDATVKAVFVKGP